MLHLLILPPGIKVLRRQRNLVHYLWATMYTKLQNNNKKEDILDVIEMHSDYAFRSTAKVYYVFNPQREERINDVMINAKIL